MNWKVILIPLLLIIIAIAAFCSYIPSDFELMYDRSSYSSPWTFRIGPVTIIDCLCLGLSFFFLLRIVTKRKLEAGFFHPEMLLIFLVFIISAIIGLFNRSEIHTWQYFFFEIRHFFLFFLFYYAGIYLFDRKLLMTTIVFLSTAVVLKALYTQAEFILHFGSGEGVGVLGGLQAIVFGEDASIYLFPACILLEYAAFHYKTKPFWFYLFLMVVFFFLVQIVFSSRRGGVLFFIGGIILLLFDQSRRKAFKKSIIKLAVFSVVNLTVIIIAIKPIRDNLDIVFTLSDAWFKSDEASLGFEIRDAEIENVKQNLTYFNAWPLGRGLGTFWKEFVYQPSDAGAGWTDLNGWYTGTHVQGLDILLKFGLIGGGIFLFAFLKIIYKYTIFRRKIKEVSDKLFSDSLLIFPVFYCWLFANPRISILCGLFLGLLSRKLWNLKIKINNFNGLGLHGNI